jgi:hypothetical protein
MHHLCDCCASIIVVFELKLRNLSGMTIMGLPATSISSAASAISKQLIAKAKAAAVKEEAKVKGAVKSGEATLSSLANKMPDCTKTTWAMPSIPMGANGLPDAEKAFSMLTDLLKGGAAKAEDSLKTQSVCMLQGLGSKSRRGEHRDLNVVLCLCSQKCIALILTSTLQGTASSAASFTEAPGSTLRGWGS